MANVFKWLKNVAKGPFAATVPADLSRCEFGCRVRQCSQGRWLTCKNRIREMRADAAA